MPPMPLLSLVVSLLVLSGDRSESRIGAESQFRPGNAISRSRIHSLGIPRRDPVKIPSGRHLSGFVPLGRPLGEGVSVRGVAAALRSLLPTLLHPSPRVGQLTLVMIVWVPGNSLSRPAKIRRRPLYWCRPLSGAWVGAVVRRRLGPFRVVVVDLVRPSRIRFTRVMPSGTSIPSKLLAPDRRAQCGLTNLPHRRSRLPIRNDWLHWLVSRGAPRGMRRVLLSRGPVVLLSDPRQRRSSCSA